MKVALKKYVIHKDRNINRLYNYAKKFRIQKIVREYIEILLKLILSTEVKELMAIFCKKPRGLQNCLIKWIIEVYTNYDYNNYN